MRKPKGSRSIQLHIDRWTDLMKRIVKNPEIVDRIPNHASLLFGKGDVVFINGEPFRYSALVKPLQKKHKSPIRKQVA